MQRDMKVRRKGTRDAVAQAAETLFFERGYAAASMDDLAAAAGVARRTLYNQFSTKEDILREVLLRVSQRLGEVLPPGIETMGDADEVLYRVAHAICKFQMRPEHVGLVRLVAAENRQSPWIGGEFRAIIDRHMERLARLLEHWTKVGILDCRDPLLAAQQFTNLFGMLLWPRVFGDHGPLPPPEKVVEEAVQMFLLRYRRAPGGKRRA